MRVHLRNTRQSTNQCQCVIYCHQKPGSMLEMSSFALRGALTFKPGILISLQRPSSIMSHVTGQAVHSSRILSARVFLSNWHWGTCCEGLSYQNWTDVSDSCLGWSKHRRWSSRRSCYNDLMHIRYPKKYNEVNVNTWVHCVFVRSQTSNIYRKLKMSIVKPVHIDTLAPQEPWSNTWYSVIHLIVVLLTKSFTYRTSLYTMPLFYQ